jgi:hypothetical protein
MANEAESEPCPNFIIAGSPGRNVNTIKIKVTTPQRIKILYRNFRMI